MQLTEITLKQKFERREGKQRNLIAVVDLCFDDAFVVKSVRIVEKVENDNKKDIIVIYPEHIKREEGQRPHKNSTAFPIDKDFALDIKEQLQDFIAEKAI